MTSASDLLKGGSKGFFSEDDPEGTSTGWVEVTDVSVQQQTDMDDDSLVFWDPPANTRPKMMIVVTVQTDRKDAPDDDGRRVIFFSGHKFTALQKVTKDINPGDFVNVTYLNESDREPKKRGFSRAKLYDVKYRKGQGPGATLDKDGPTQHTQKPADTVPMNSGAQKPADFPQAAWDHMPEDARVALVASRGPAKAVKPDSFPQAAWDTMDETARDAVVKSLGGSPV